MYKEILEQTLRLYDEMPVVIPEKGILAGFIKASFPSNCDLAFQNDNHHFPMGTAFLKYGIKRIADLARVGISDKKTDLQNEMLDGISKVYDTIASYFSKYVTQLNKRISEATDDRERLIRIKIIWIRSVKNRLKALSRVYSFIF